MTDKQTATGKTAGLVDASIWRVDGAATAATERGLDDTVVRIPPVPANGAAPPAGPTSPSVLAHKSGPEFEPTLTTPAASPAPAVATADSLISPTPRKGVRRTRKARLRLSRLDPWSVMKTVFLFSIAFGVMFWVALWMVWSIVETSGVFPAINATVTELVSSPNDTSPWQIEDFVSMNKVLGIGALIAVVNVVLMTALGTIMAFLYNLSANILGGLEVTLAED